MHVLRVRAIASLADLNAIHLEKVGAARVDGRDGGGGKGGSQVDSRLHGVGREADNIVILYITLSLYALR